MPDWDLLITDARIATMHDDTPGYGAIEDGVIAVKDGAIAWLGTRSQLPANATADSVSVAGRWITPALIDCHTHLVFGGDRADEYEQRLQGISYAEIARAGGGIMATVNATRAQSATELLASAVQRARALMRDGVATIEIKSGYGLDVANEIKSLQVAREVAKATGLSIRTTLLAAHAVPPEFSDDADAYVDLVCDELLPRVAELRLADAVDAYCESFAFSAEQIARVFTRAKELNLPVKLHADQLSDGGGAALAAQFSALSADHLEYTSTEGVAAMSSAGTTAVLLPGAFLTLRETQLPPVAQLREQQVPIAIATDCNPGTSPLLSVREAMALASRLFGLTPVESLAAATRNAARALGLADRGVLAPGLRADLAVWDVAHPRDLSYWLGSQPLSGLFIAGRDASLT